MPRTEPTRAARATMRGEIRQPRYVQDRNPFTKFDPLQENEGLLQGLQGLKLHFQDNDDTTAMMSQEKVSKSSTWVDLG